MQGGLARTPERVFVYCSTCPIMFAVSAVNSCIGGGGWVGGNWRLEIGDWVEVR